MRLTVHTLSVFCLSLFVTALIGHMASAQPVDGTTSLEDRVEVRSDKTLFTLFAFLTIGHPSPNLEKMSPLRQFLRLHLERVLPETEKQRAREVVAPVAGDRMLEYWAVMAGVRMEPAPSFRLRERELEEGLRRAGANVDEQMKPLRGLKPILAELPRFYEQAGIERLWTEVRPWHAEAEAAYRGKVVGLLRRSLQYLRITESHYLRTQPPQVIIPLLIGPRGSAMGTSAFGTFFNVYCPWDGADFSPHEAIHTMVEPVTRAATHRERIVAIARKCMEGPKTDATAYYPDPVLFFDECLVRVLDHVTTDGWETPEQRSKTSERLKVQSAKGFTLIEPMLAQLREYEATTGSFADFFPRLLERLER